MKLNGPSAWVILFLLLFMVGWPLPALLSDRPIFTEEESDLVGWALLLIIFGPPIWAGGLVAKILEKSSRDD